MKQINREYEELFKEVAHIHEKPGEPGKTYKTKEGAFEDGYRAVMDTLAGLAARCCISVELCGSWLWISGDTRSFKDYLKAAGCKWSGKKRCGTGIPATSKDAGAAGPLRRYASASVRRPWDSQTRRKSRSRSNFKERR